MDRRTYAQNRIKQIRKARGISLEALGAAMENELTASTVAKLENSKMALSADYMLDIARALQCSPMDLLVEGGEPVRTAPVIGRVSAGTWQEAIEVAEEFMPIPAHLNGPHLFVLRPDGDSMDRIVTGPDGFIVVDPDQRDLVDKKYYVVMNGDGEATFKQFCANPLQLLPCSTNPAHVPIALGATPFTVIGRVVYVGQEL